MRYRNTGRASCDNHRGQVLQPGCFDGSAELWTSVIYHEKPFTGGVESDSFALCEGCSKALRHDAEGHGYYTEASPL